MGVAQLLMPWVGVVMLMQSPVQCMREAVVQVGESCRRDVLRWKEPRRYPPTPPPLTLTPCIPSLPPSPPSLPHRRDGEWIAVWVTGGTEETTNVQSNLDDHLVLG